MYFIYIPPYRFIFGSSASLSPSANKLNDKMIILIVSAGKNNLYGYELNEPTALLAKEPRDGIGTSTPSPKKLRNDSVNIADGI